MADSDSTVQNHVPNEDSSSEKLHQHHVSGVLDDVLEETAPAEIPPRLRHPMVVDIVLAVGLLTTLAAFAAGLMRMYVAHAAEQSMIKGNFKAAIAILKGTPLPSVFEPPGSEPKELLDKAYYLDAMEKLNAYSEDQSALKELESIEPGSPFFELAQIILKEHSNPSAASQDQQVSTEQVNAGKPEIPQPPAEGNP
jgi:hypothetical protein